MPIKIDPEALYSPKEAESILGKSEKTQAKDRCLGSGPPFVKMGKNAIFYRGSDLLARTEDRRVHHGAEYRERFSSAGEAA